jgi:GMP synthase (glutamine-hydrolysing)
MTADFHHEIADRHDKTLIVDFGSQVTQLIARRVREAGVYCEIAPFQSAGKAFAEIKPKAVILSGGPCSVTEPGSPRAPREIFDSGVPVLAICYGEQLSAAPMSRLFRQARCSTTSGSAAKNIRCG